MISDCKHESLSFVNCSTEHAPKELARWCDDCGALQLAGMKDWYLPTIHKSYDERLKARLEEAGRLDPGERFERMVRNGFINRQGELTKAHGGTAEPDNSPVKTSSARCERCLLYLGCALCDSQDCKNVEVPHMKGLQEEAL